MEQTLTAMGERGDILRTMHKALKGQPRELVLKAELATPVVGRIAAKGLTDELNDRGYLVVDGTDGRAHYVQLPTGADLAALPEGGIVEVKTAGAERSVDRNIARVARGGIYRTTDHLRQLRQAAVPDPLASVEIHVRRLEALRRSGTVERLADGVWHVPSEFLSRAQVHDARQAAGPAIELRSHLSIAYQVSAQGATWLDHQMVANPRDRDLSQMGFGAQVRKAMQDRQKFLVAQGLAEQRGARLLLAPNLLLRLRNRELTEAGKKIQNQTGLAHRLLRDGERATGVYRRTIQLTSGRFAMLDDGVGFSLVPWKPILEHRLGRAMSAVVRGSSVSWQLTTQPGMSR